MTKPPDVCKFVFVCAHGDWQVQLAPRVRSDLGGAVEAFREIAEAHRDHIVADHTDAEAEVMRRTLARLGAPESITSPADGHMSGAMFGTPLPRWWVDR